LYIDERATQEQKDALPLDYTRGYVYVTDTGNDRVQKFTSDGKFIAKWGSSGSGPGQFQTPIGIDEDESAALSILYNR
jgi:DNA-binding beta-propeller fold protein YncE